MLHLDLPKHLEVPGKRKHSKGLLVVGSLLLNKHALKASQVLQHLLCDASEEDCLCLSRIAGRQ